MANLIPFSFRGALLSAQHDFANGGHNFKIALYSASPYSTSSTVYLAGASNDEVSSGSSSNYTQGGEALQSQAVASALRLLQLILQMQVGVKLLLQQRLQLFIIVQQLMVQR